MPKGAVVDISGIQILDMAQAQKKRLGSLLDLTDKQKKRIKKRLHKEIESWMDETEELHRQLEEDNDLVEGIVEETDFPWEGAYNTHVPITGTYMAIFRSVQRRSILGADVVWYAEVEPGNKSLAQEVLAKIEEMMNYKARKEWNISEALSGVIWTANRDGLGVMQVVYAEEYELMSDVFLAVSVDDFISEFPTPREAGLEPRDYAAAVKQIASAATNENPVEVPYTAEKLKYQGPKGYVVDLVNFAVFPATTPDIEDENCRGYGKRYSLRKGVVRKRREEGTWYADAVSRLMKKGGGSSETPAFIRGQEEIEGLRRKEGARDYWFFELVYKIDIGDGERKYLFTYNYDDDELVAAMEYPYRVDHYAIFRVDSRPNRLLGVSVPKQTRGLNDEIDAQHNQRLNSRTISSVPSFKGRKGSQADFDPEAEENRWRPGVIFWLTDPDAFDQFRVQPVDLGESMSEERNNMNLLDMRTGAAASLLSGHVAPGDPTAPGNKTVAMIGQTNMRMDDPISELRKGVEKVGDICLSHEYQFGPIFIKFQGVLEDGGREDRTLHKKNLRGARMRMSAVTAAQNPDAEYARALQLYSVYSKDPIVAQDDEIRYELLREPLRRGRVQNREKMLPPLEVVRQRATQRQAAAMKQMAQEQEAEKMQAQAAAEKQRLQEERKSLHLRRTAREIAERGLGLKKRGQGDVVAAPV